MEPVRMSCCEEHEPGIIKCRCNGPCGEVKLLTEFGFKTHKRHDGVKYEGHNFTCKQCSREQQRKYKKAREAKTNPFSAVLDDVYDEIIIDLENIKNKISSTIAHVEDLKLNS